jgi:hypothetical protein
MRSVSKAQIQPQEFPAMTIANRFARALFTNFAVGIALLAAIGPAVAQEEPQMPKPTEQHKIFKKDVGTWDASIKVWHAPNTPAIESKGSEKNELLGDGFWLLSRFEGKIGDIPFSGAGTFGYDPVEKKYIGTWVDTMTPYMMTLKSDYDAAKKTMTGTGESRDPISGKIMKSKHITRLIDDDTKVFEIHMDGPNGKEYKMLEITYKRSPTKTVE